VSGGVPLRVIDQSGCGLGGVRVQLRLPGLPQPVGEGITDGRGVVAFGMRRPGHYVVDAHHERLGSVFGRALEVRAGERGADLRVGGAGCLPTVEIACDASLVVRFYDGSGPLGGLDVWLRSYPDGPWVTTLRRTDRDGWLRVSGLAAGRLQLEIGAAGWWPMPILVEALSAEEAPRVAPTSVRMFRRGRLELHLRGLRGRRYIPRSKMAVDFRAVELGRLEDWLARGMVRASTRNALPDRDGRLVLDGLPAAPLVWSVRFGSKRRRGRLLLPADGVESLTVDLRTHRRCLVPNRSAVGRSGNGL